MSLPLLETGRLKFSLAKEFAQSHQAGKRAECALHPAFGSQIHTSGFSRQRPLAAACSQRAPPFLPALHLAPNLGKGSAVAFRAPGDQHRLTGPSLTPPRRLEQCSVLFKKFFKCLFIIERQRKTEHEQGRGRERERETQNLKQAPGSELSAQSPTRGSNPPTVRS